MAKENKEPDVIEIKFSKGQLIESKRFNAHQDLLNTILDYDKQYTLEEVVSKMEKYLKDEVK